MWEHEIINRRRELMAEAEQNRLVEMAHLHNPPRPLFSALVERIGLLLARLSWRILTRSGAQSVRVPVSRDARIVMTEECACAA